MCMAGLCLLIALHWCGLAAGGDGYDWDVASAALATTFKDGISAEGVVRAMRHQRHPWMVEGAAQYQFVYDVIGDELTARAGPRK